MYSKTIKRGKKKYIYYYHNLKEKGRVNYYLGCLESSRKEALIKLKSFQLKNNNELSFRELLKNTPSPHSSLQFNITKKKNGFAKSLDPSTPKPLKDNKHNKYLNIFKNKRKNTRSLNPVQQKDSVVSSRLKDNKNKKYKKLLNEKKKNRSHSQTIKSKRLTPKSIIHINKQIYKVFDEQSRGRIAGSLHSPVKRETPKSHGFKFLSSRIGSPVPGVQINNKYAQTSSSANPSPVGISNLSKVFLLLLFIFIGVGLFYTGNNNITGYVVFSDNNINLDVNKLVSQDAQVFVNVAGQEAKKPLSEFNLPLVNKKFNYEKDGD